MYASMQDSVLFTCYLESFTQKLPRLNETGQFHGTIQRNFDSNSTHRAGKFCDPTDYLLLSMFLKYSFYHINI